MNRTGLLIVLAIAAAVGTVFAIAPKLDIALEAPFFDSAGIGFWARVDGVLLPLRTMSSWAIALVAAPAFVALAVKLVRPRLAMLLPARAVLLMIATLALGPGLITNILLKDHWGRPRPIDIAEFGGDEHFVPWWDPRGDCPKNCSFVAGEPSGAFWTLAPAVVLPAPWRAVASATALTFGVMVGLLRMAAGGHFLTDVVFAGVFTFLLIWLAHGLIYRFAATRISDRVVEDALERILLPGHAAGARMFARLRQLFRRGGSAS
jgi:lipid A 4'-phosphatase